MSKKHLTNDTNALFQNAQAAFHHFKKKSEVSSFDIAPIGRDEVRIKARLSVSKEEQTFVFRDSYGNKEIRSVIKERIESLKTKSLAA